jgi:hypothetical protein
VRTKTGRAERITDVPASVVQLIQKCLKRFVGFEGEFGVYMLAVGLHGVVTQARPGRNLSGG